MPLSEGSQPGPSAPIDRSTDTADLACHRIFSGRLINWSGTENPIIYDGVNCHHRRMTLARKLVYFLPSSAI